MNKSEMKAGMRVRCLTIDLCKPYTDPSGYLYDVSASALRSNMCGSDDEFIISFVGTEPETEELCVLKDEKSERGVWHCSWIENADEKDLDIDIESLFGL